MKPIPFLVETLALAGVLKYALAMIGVEYLGRKGGFYRVRDKQGAWLMYPNDCISLTVNQCRQLGLLP